MYWLICYDIYNYVLFAHKINASNSVLSYQKKKKTTRDMQCAG